MHHLCTCPPASVHHTRARVQFPGGMQPLCSTDGLRHAPAAPSKLPEQRALGKQDDRGEHEFDELLSPDREESDSIFGDEHMDVSDSQHGGKVCWPHCTLSSTRLVMVYIEADGRPWTRCPLRARPNAKTTIGTPYLLHVALSKVSWTESVPGPPFGLVGVPMERSAGVLIRV